MALLGALSTARLEVLKAVLLGAPWVLLETLKVLHLGALPLEVLPLVLPLEVLGAPHLGALPLEVLGALPLVLPLEVLLVLHMGVPPLEVLAVPHLGALPLVLP